MAQRGTSESQGWRTSAYGALPDRWRDTLRITQFLREIIKPISGLSIPCHKFVARLAAPRQ